MIARLPIWLGLRAAPRLSPVEIHIANASQQPPYRPEAGL